MPVTSCLRSSTTVGRLRLKATMPAITYQNEARDSLVFLEKTYRQMEVARREIEQNGYGNTNLLQNGMTIYIASNYELRTANWSKDNVNCTFYGGISESDLLKCLESIEFEKEK